MHISKIVENDNNWVKVSGNAQTGILVNNNHPTRLQYYFGLEEWNNSQILKNHKLAYLDSFRRFKRESLYDRIELIRFSQGIIYHVGRLSNVRGICNQEISRIRRELMHENWLECIENDFHEIGDLRRINENVEYNAVWESNQIVGPRNSGFIANIKYEEQVFFENPRNLTILEGFDNNRYKRLSQLYNLQIQNQHYFENNS
jgi:hypothetical protein